jgi:hypothetical protein
MHLSVLELIMITCFGILLLLVLYCEFLCIKRIRKVEEMLRDVYPLIGHEKTNMAENLKYSLEALKEINKLFALRVQQDKEAEKRTLN